MTTRKLPKAPFIRKPGGFVLGYQGLEYKNTQVSESLPAGMDGPAGPMTSSGINIPVLIRFQAEQTRIQEYQPGRLPHREERPDPLITHRINRRVRPRNTHAILCTVFRTRPPERPAAFTAPAVSVYFSSSFLLMVSNRRFSPGTHRQRWQH
jgi:hypothetical protein